VAALSTERERAALSAARLKLCSLLRCGGNQSSPLSGPLFDVFSVLWQAQSPSSPHWLPGCDLHSSPPNSLHLHWRTALVTANNLRTASMVALEDLATGAFLALTGFFLVDLRCFAIHQEWTLLHGDGSFGQRSQPHEARSAILPHAAGMLAWMFIVAHELRAKGRAPSQRQRGGALLGWVHRSLSHLHKSGSDLPCDGVTESFQHSHVCEPVVHRSHFATQCSGHPHRGGGHQRRQGTKVAANGALPAHDLCCSLHSITWPLSHVSSPGAVCRVLFERQIKAVMLLHALSLQPDVGAPQMDVLVPSLDSSFLHI